ncbi:uncharacterized protein BJ171DRAFT_474440 [Polychytrium aggregatum]|uniref:uncharacterized protein n=1 Tax=Polychytrium aggregatum TaxID=110093 RepID=UPI0022FDE6AB|nr:uncharacterized protein BJ171DRAFT_474440 [Polychytrium aggregatum]KAI9205014.1 hypothetical protein BJ171DRAFT_474440 [Polychytrium aggregatum]
MCPNTGSGATKCYLSVTALSSHGPNAILNAYEANYRVTHYQAQQLSLFSHFFEQIQRQDGCARRPAEAHLSPNDLAPTIRISLPMPMHFDALLHWLYHQDDEAIHQALDGDADSDSLVLYFGLIENARYLLVQDSFFEALGVWTGRRWSRLSLHLHPKFTHFHIPEPLIVAAVLAVPYSCWLYDSVDTQMLDKWANDNRFKHSKITKRLGLASGTGFQRLAAQNPSGPPTTDSEATLHRFGAPVAKGHQDDHSILDLYITPDIVGTHCRGLERHEVTDDAESDTLRGADVEDEDSDILNQSWPGSKRSLAALASGDRAGSAKGGILQSALDTVAMTGSKIKGLGYRLKL